MEEDNKRRKDLKGIAVKCDQEWASLANGNEEDADLIAALRIYTADKSEREERVLDNIIYLELKVTYYNEAFKNEATASRQGHEWIKADYLEVKTKLTEVEAELKKHKKRIDEPLSLVSTGKSLRSSGDATESTIAVAEDKKRWEPIRKEILGVVNEAARVAEPSKDYQAVLSDPELKLCANGAITG